MNCGCQLMVGEIKAILLKRPQNVFIGRFTACGIGLIGMVFQKFDCARKWRVD